MHWLLIIPKKPHFGPLAPKTSKDKYYKIKIIGVDFKSLCCCNSTQKRFHALTFGNTLKNLILGSFQTPFGLKISKQDFPKKFVKVNFKWICYYNFKTKQSEQFHALIFMKLEKPNFRPILDPFGPKIHIARFFQKIRLRQFLN